MFDFLFADSHENRVVANYDVDGVVIDTTSVNDGKHPYETGICHPEYNNGKWIIVEAYDTRDAAQIGHDKWVEIMTSPDLPESITDCCNSHVSDLLVITGNDITFSRKSMEVPI